MPNAALQAGAGAAKEEVRTNRKVTPQLLVHDLVWLLLRTGNPLQLSLLRSPADSASCAPCSLRACCSIRRSSSLALRSPRTSLPSSKEHTAGAHPAAQQPAISALAQTWAASSTARHSSQHYRECPVQRPASALLVHFARVFIYIMPASARPALQSQPCACSWCVSRVTAVL